MARPNEQTTEQWLSEYSGESSVSTDKLEQLRRPFPVNQLKWRKGGGGKELVYIDARQYQQRLDEVMGSDWQCKYSHVTHTGITCCEVWLKIGDEWLWRASGAGETNIEGAKGTFTDAFKRACSAWGLGRYLYNIKDKNNIPDWASPEGYDKLMKQRQEAA
jgi:hypothetical protein